MLWESSCGFRGSGSRLSALFKEMDDWRDAPAQAENRTGKARHADEAAAEEIVKGNCEVVALVR